MQKTLYLFTLLLFCCVANAQSRSDSTTAQHSPVRTLTYKEYQALLKGEAMNDMALVAEMNHYPMPDRILRWRNELDLSSIQIKKITEVNSYMHKRRLQTGGSIIANERTLDSLFRIHHIDDGTLVFYATRTGAYLGEMKNAILQACVSTQKLLSEQQIARFESLEKPN